MSETIKAKTTQRLSRRRRLSCHLRVWLSSLRDTIVPLLLLLEVLADASYPSILIPKPLCAPIVEKTKRCTTWNYSLSSSSSHTHLKGSCPPSLRPLVRALVAPQGAPLMRCSSYEAFADSVVLDADSPICRVLLREHDT